ncbi:hypothetical protein CPB97_011771, partial [Podila verticillata]
GIDKLKKAYKSFSEVEEEEHIIGILASLVRNLPLESGHRLRVVRKFVEEDYAKLERLLDLREGYEARVQAVDEKITRENEEQELDEDEIKEEEPLRALQRLDAGLYCMQLIDLILAHLCAENLDLEVEEENKANGGSSSEESESEIKVRARTLLNRRGQSLDDIKDNLKAYLDTLEVNEELALQARTKLLAQAGSGPLSEATTTIVGEADKEEEGEIAAPKTELTAEEDVALEALEAKESVQYMLGLL